MTFIKNLWTDERWQLAQQMCEQGCDFDAIAHALKLTRKQVQDKFTNEAYRGKALAARQREREALAARDAIANAPRTLTAIVNGDPLPGRSALDKKRTGATG